ncbi:MAG: type II secretion system F family protein [Planctomycetota bacterium]|jgi:type IV pilus assembly protein PilC
MAKFKYTAVDKAGKKIEDTVNADNEEAAKVALRRLNLQVTSISAAGGLFSSSVGGTGGKTPKARVSSQDMVIFTRQFATMIGAGIPVMECLEILSEQADDPGFKALLNNVTADVRSGSDLSQAMGKHPVVFPDIYVNMIRAGEASGQIDTILVRLAEYQEATEALKSEIKSAMTYPCISIVMILGITTFLLVFIIPKFEKIFKQMGVPLPAPTKLVLAVSKFMTERWYIIIGATVGLAVFVISYKKTKQGKEVFDKLVLKLPVFGGLFQKVALSRFSRTFATLLRSGVPILGALEIVSQTAGNSVLSTAIDASRESIRQGDNLAKPLASCPIFPPMVVRMIQVGERSGALEVLLEKISEFYDQQVSATVDALTSLIEPLMIGVMGFMVGGIVLSVFLPIFEMQKSIGKK